MEFFRRRIISLTTLSKELFYISHRVNVRGVATDEVCYDTQPVIALGVADCVVIFKKNNDTFATFHASILGISEVFNVNELETNHETFEEFFNDHDDFEYVASILLNSFAIL